MGNYTSNACGKDRCGSKDKDFHNASTFGKRRVQKKKKEHKFALSNDTNCEGLESPNQLGNSSTSTMTRQTDLGRGSETSQESQYFPDQDIE